MNGISIVILLLLAAAVVLAVRHAHRHKGSCEGCTGCGGSTCCGGRESRQREKETRE